MTAAVTDHLDLTERNDLAQVEACRRGDGMAWRALYDAHFPFALRTARRLGVPASEAEDVVHESFEVVFRKLDRFVEGQFSTWLYSIVARTALARARRVRVRELFASLWSSEPEPEAAPVDATVEARRRLAGAEQVLRSLSAEKRQVFALHELEGLTHERIAALTGVKVDTVRTRLHYAKKDFERLARKRGLVP